MTAIVLLGAGGETVVGWEKDRPLSILDLDGAARVLEAARVFRLIDPAWIISSGGLQSQHVGIDEAESGGGKDARGRRSSCLHQFDEATSTLLSRPIGSII